jgi:hypothetical protein
MGTLKDPSDPKDPMQVRLDLDHVIPRMWSMQEGHWVEVKPGAFKIDRHQGNAMMYAIDSGGDQDGTWVETWALNMTLRSSQELLVEWTRVVSNVNLPSSSKDRSFSQHTSGVLTRTVK